MSTYTVQVIHAYTRFYADPLRVRAGEALTITDRTDYWREQLWVWCVDARGKEGWVPDRYLDRERGTIHVDYSAWELSAAQGEILTVLDQTHGWLWCASAQREQGWIPEENVIPT